MTIPELKDLAQRMFDSAIEQILESGDLSQMFCLVTRGGVNEVLSLDGAVSNSESAKAELARGLKQRVAEGEIEAVLMRSDVFFAQDLSPEANAVRKRLRMTIEEAAAFGLCKKREAVLVTLESPILVQHMQQEYARDGRSITLVGAPIIEDDSADGMRQGPARFTGFFPRRSTGGAAP